MAVEEYGSFGEEYFLITLTTFLGMGALKITGALISDEIRYFVVYQCTIFDVLLGYR